MNFDKKIQAKNKSAAAKGITNFLDEAKEDGRFLELPASSFFPDINQPRKTFSQSDIDELQVSIEKNGQLQPILVGDVGADGKYPIIAGERRWRAISQSETITTVLAVIKSGSQDELGILLMQFAENADREDVLAIEEAQAMNRVVDLCKAQGQDQAAAAAILGVSPGKLSKYLSLLSAPALVSGLSLNGETQDVEVLYNLTKAAESNPEEVDEFVERWRNGDLDSNLRQASKELSAEVRAQDKGKGSGKKTPAEKKTPGLEDVELREDGGVFFLDLIIKGGKKTSHPLPAEIIVKLKQQIAKNWR